MKSLSFVSPWRRPWRLAPRALRERLECSEGGNTGRRAQRPYRSRAAIRSAPNRDRRSARVIGGLGKKRQEPDGPANSRVYAAFGSRAASCRRSAILTESWTTSRQWRAVSALGSLLRNR